MFHKRTPLALLYVLLVSLILAACGDNPTPAPVEVLRTVPVTVLVTAPPVQAQPQVVTVEVTRVVERIITATPAPSPTRDFVGSAQQTASARPTLQPATPTAGGLFSSTPAPVATTAAVSSGSASSSEIGKELIGQSAESQTLGLRFKVTAVDRVTEVMDTFKNTTIKSQGAFMIVQYEMENIGTKPATSLGERVVDNKGRKFSPTTNFDAISAFSSSRKYKNDSLVQPGLKGVGYAVFEVPADAVGFKFELDYK